MHTISGLAGSITALTLLAGCAAQPAAPPVATASAAPAPAPAVAGGDIDGVYRSPTGPTAGNSRCGTTKFNYPIRVAAGTVSMPSVANGTLEGPVGPDGSLAIEKGRASLRGQFANGQFNGVYGTGGCSFVLAYTKR